MLPCDLREARAAAFATDGLYADAGMFHAYKRRRYETDDATRRTEPDIDIDAAGTIQVDGTVEVGTIDIAEVDAIDVEAASIDIAEGDVIAVDPAAIEIAEGDAIDASKVDAIDASGGDAIGAVELDAIDAINPAAIGASEVDIAEVDAIDAVDPAAIDAAEVDKVAAIDAVDPAIDIAEVDAIDAIDPAAIDVVQAAAIDAVQAAAIDAAEVDAIDAVDEERDITVTSIDEGVMTTIEDAALHNFASLADSSLSLHTEGQAMWWPVADASPWHDSVVRDWRPETRVRRGLGDVTWGACSLRVDIPTSTGRFTYVDRHQGMTHAQYRRLACGARGVMEYAGQYVNIYWAPLSKDRRLTLVIADANVEGQGIWSSIATCEPQAYAGDIWVRAGLDRCETTETPLYDERGAYGSGTTAVVAVTWSWSDVSLGEVDPRAVTTLRGPQRQIILLDGAPIGAISYS